jgi:hypothetical protein
MNSKLNSQRQVVQTGTLAFSAFFAAILLASCASFSPLPHPVAPLPPETGPESQFNLENLKAKLGLQGVNNDLGYHEAKFDSCQPGQRVPSEQSCGPRVLSVVRFRLECRDSEGTVNLALAPTDLKPISMKAVRWSLANRDGEVKTDSMGYSELIGFYAQSPRSHRLRIAVGNDFLYMRAEEITRVVVPQSWCAD